jgi:hypothetical protein
VNGLQVCKLVVIRVNTHAEKEASISTVHNLVIPELRERGKKVGEGLNDKKPDRGNAHLNKIGLVFLVARGD